MTKKLSYLILLGVLLGAAAAQAADVQWIRACYYDTRYATGWAGDGTATKDALVVAGYTALNADELKTWMQDRIKDKKYSVVVFCQDMAPDTVCETQSNTCTLRKYLDAGGKIVWYSDIPFYYQAHATGVNDTWGDNGAVNVLTIGAVNLWDSGNTVKITATGAKWGLTKTWSSARPIAASTANIEVLATDNAGNAAAWVKHFVAKDKFRGFVRFYDTAAGQASISIADIIRVAEYVGNKASNPDPANGATGVVLSLLRWDASSFAVAHRLYVGTSPDLGQADFKGRLGVTQAMYFGPPWEPGKIYYWRVDEEEGDGYIRTGDLWSFTAAPVTAFSPVPRNGDKWIDPNADLSWQAGAGSFSHALYFGTDQAAVTARDASVSKGEQYVAGFELDKLAPETTYYWAVDEIGAATYPGPVWSFTTAAAVVSGGVKGEYFNNQNLSGVPVLTRIDPSIDFNWGDPATTATDPGSPGASIPIDHFSARWTADLEVAVADDYVFITTSDDGARLWLNDNLIVDAWVDQGATDHASEPQKLDPGIYSLRMEYYENTGGAMAQLSWQTPFVARQIIPAGPLQPPVRAKAIYPKDNDANVPQDLTLTWSTGEKAVTHDIYFGEDEAAVAAATTADTGIYKGSQAKENNTWTPGALEWNKTYYWRIDEVNPAEAESPWKSSVWSFTTANFLVVDDFESYTDEDVGRIFQTWIDGWGYTTPPPGNPGNGTGATVGYIDPPFAEKTIVHSGGQSMPLGFNNADSPFYSETERTFDSPQNWTVNGVTTLSLQVYGYPAVTSTAVTETGGKMTLTGDGADIWNASDDFTFAYKNLSGDATIVAKVTSVGTGTNSWAKGGVMIRNSLDGGSVDAYMVMTGNTAASNAGNGASFQYRNPTSPNGGNVDSTAVVAPPYWVKLERVGDTFTGYLSADGSSWAMLGTQDVVMSGPVYIGICITSHQPGEQRTFQFEGIKTTGSVTGAWQGAVISSPKYNSAQNLYVALQDSTGKIAVVKDATAVNATTWTEVKMPLSSFTGVSASKIKKIFIGVGDRNAPVADGAGMLFIDDIRVIKP
jgi:hypothetical protein